jgi:hypothetical protein
MQWQPNLKNDSFDHQSLSLSIRPSHGLGFLRKHSPFDESPGTPKQESFYEVGEILVSRAQRFGEPQA